MSTHAGNGLDESTLGAALRSALDGRWASVRHTARTQLPIGELGPDPALDMEASRKRVAEQMLRLVESGYPQAGFNPDHGGGGDPGASVTSFEMLAHADLSLLVKAGVQWGLFGGAVENLGTERHHAAYLRDIIDLSLPGCFAMTETGHGSDVQSLGTTATYDASAAEFVIETPDASARKDYIGGAARDARMCALFAQLASNGQGHGVHCFMVAIRDEQGRPMPGVTIEDDGVKAGLNGVDNGRLSFAEVRVPREALLNRYGDVAPDGTYSSDIDNVNRRFFTTLGALVRGRISVAGGAGAATRLALDIAIRYAVKRTQFKGPDGTEVVVMDYRTHQRRLLPLLAKSYALAFAQNELVSRMHDIMLASSVDSRDQRELESRAAGIKAMTTWHATRAIQECRESCGGAGYLASNRLSILKADTDVFTTFEGDNTVLMQLVAKELLVNYADEFSGLDAMGMVRFATRQFRANVVERTAARELIQRLVDVTRSRGVEDRDLLSRGTHLSMLEDRESHVLDTVARRLRRAKDEDANAFAVFNDAQDHVVHAAKAHIERVVLEAFVAGIEACVDIEAKTLMGKVCDLYCLSVIEDDLAWFMGHGRLTPNRAKAVTGAVNQLCADLRPDVLTLVEGFGIPTAWLQAEMLNNA